MSEAPQQKISLGGVAARGGITLGTVGLIENGVQFLRALLLARILAPGDFGLMGMALIAMQAGESLSQTGFHRALIQKRENAERYIDTVWVISLIRGVVLSALLFLLAPLIGRFFSTEAAVPIIRVLSCVFFLNGCQNPALYLLERDLEFIRFTTPRVVGIVGDLGLSVLLALLLRNVWAMVWGYLFGRVLLIILTYLVRPYRPAMRFQRAQASELYSYGQHISRATAVDYIMMQTDKAIVGHSLGAEPLGLYSFAWRLATLPATAVANVVISLAFPLFSKVQDDLPRFRAGFVRALGMMAALTVPVSVGLATVSTDLVAVAFGEKWAGMTPALRVLCLAGTCMSLFYLISAILAGGGRPEVGARGTYLFLGVMAIPIYPAIKTLGILGAAWCMAIAATVAFIGIAAASLKVVGCGLADLARTLAPPVVASLAMSGILLAARAWLAFGPTLGHLVLEVVSGAAVYLLVAVVLDAVLDAGLLPSLRSAFRTA